MAECGKGFTHPTTRNNHEASHGGSYLCEAPGCGEVFGSPSKLSSHGKRHKEGQGEARKKARQAPAACDDSETATEAA